jgi:hypothetical protein
MDGPTMVLKADWRLFQGGKPSGEATTFTMTRKKSVGCPHR